MIIKDKFYSSIEAQHILGIRSRQFISRYVQDGFLLAVVTGKNVGKRYLIRGDWLDDFKKRYDKGLVQKERYSKEETKEILKEALKKLNK